MSSMFVAIVPFWWTKQLRSQLPEKTPSHHRRNFAMTTEEWCRGTIGYGRCCSLENVWKLSWRSTNGWEKYPSFNEWFMMTWMVQCVNWTIGPFIIKLLAIFILWSSSKQCTDQEEHSTVTRRTNKRSSSRGRWELMVFDGTNPLRLIAPFYSALSSMCACRFQVAPEVMTLQQCPKRGRVRKEAWA
jgi:hypothetical protein